MQHFTTDISEFMAALPPEGRLAGLDVGKKTIGVAISDGLRMIASPLETIQRKKLSGDLQKLDAIKSAQRITGWVVGYPVNMDGSEGPRCQSTRQFAQDLTRNLSLPLLLWDERLSTAAVERVMLEGDLSRQRRSELVDKSAAAFFLQGALDALQRR